MRVRRALCRPLRPPLGQGDCGSWEWDGRCRTELIERLPEFLSIHAQPPGRLGLVSADPLERPPKVLSLDFVQRRPSGRGSASGDAWACGGRREKAMDFGLAFGAGQHDGLGGNRFTRRQHYRPAPGPWPTPRCRRAKHSRRAPARPSGESHFAGQAALPPGERGFRSPRLRCPARPKRRIRGGVLHASLRWFLFLSIGFLSLWQSWTLRRRESPRRTNKGAARQP